MSGEDEILAELISESREHLSAIEPDFLELENEGANASADLVNRIFRAIHSIKGGASFFGLEKITELTHVMESVLMRVRDGELTVTPEMADGLLKGADRLSEMLDDAAASNDYDISEHLAPLQVFLSGGAPADAQPTEKPAEGQTEASNEQESDKKETEEKAEAPKPAPKKAPPPKKADPKKSSAAAAGNETIRVKLNLLNSLMNLAGELVLSRNEIKQHLTSNLYDTLMQGPAITKLEYELNSISQDLITSLANSQNGQIKRSVDSSQEEIKKAVKQMLTISLGETPGLQSTVQNMDMIITQLQGGIMNTRMQPVSAVFSKFPRIVRDLARSLDKEIDLEMEGQEVELDKTVIEALNDPLTHLIRNSADHGVESPDDREAAGKSRTGTVHLKAYHEGGQVNIDIVDDGGGINPEKIKAAAVSKGVITEEEAAQLSDKEACNLIFMAGFSTAEKISDVSGRGVGMDVVRTNIENIGGVIELDSVYGQGTTINLKLPLTLAIVPSLIMSCEGQTYAVPQVNLIELVRVSAGESSEKIAHVHGKPVLRLRETLLPLVELRSVLGVDKTYVNEQGKRVPDRRKNFVDRRAEDVLDETQEAGGDQRATERSGEDRRQAPESAINIVVLQVGSHSYGLVVDDLSGNAENVVKPLSVFIKNCKAYSGATIMGDGSVAMILDAPGIAEFAGLHFGGDMENAQDLNSKRFESMKNEAQTLLKFKNGTDETFAINLSMVDRIEKINLSDLKTIGDKEFLQYESSSLRVLRMQDFMPVKKPEKPFEEHYVIVTKLVKHPMGILISGVEDIIELFHDIDRTSVTGPGIMGSVVTEGETIVFLNIYQLFEIADPELYAKEDEENILQDLRVLLAEDTSFFRNVIKDFLKELGCQTDAAVDGKEAWELINKNDYDILVTDIVMPEMDGIELTRSVRGSEKYSQLPIVAVTSLKNESDKKKIMDSGVDEYQAKLDKAALEDVLKRFARERINV